MPLFCWYRALCAVLSTSVRPRSQRRSIGLLVVFCSVAGAGLLIGHQAQSQPFDFDLSSDGSGIVQLENGQSIRIQSGVQLGGAVTGSFDQDGGVPSDISDLVGADNVTVVIENGATLLIPSRLFGEFVQRTMAIEVGNNSIVAIDGTINTVNGKGGVLLGAGSRLIGGFDADGNPLPFSGTINASAVDQGLLTGPNAGNARAGALVIDGPLSEDLIIDGRITSGRYSNSGTIRINEDADVPDGETRRIVLTENAEILNLESLVNRDAQGVEALGRDLSTIVGIPVGEGIALLADGYVIDNSSTIDSIFIGRQEDFAEPITAEVINRSGAIYNSLEAHDGVDLTVRSDGGVIENIFVGVVRRSSEAGVGRLTLQGVEGGDGVFRAEIVDRVRSPGTSFYGSIQTDVLYGDNRLEVQANEFLVDELENGSITLVGDSVINFRVTSPSFLGFDVDRGTGRIALLDETIVRSTIRARFMDELDFELGPDAQVRGHLLFGATPTYRFGTLFSDREVTSADLELNALIEGDVRGRDNSSGPGASGAGHLYFTNGNVTLTETGRIRQIVGDNGTIVNAGRVYGGFVPDDGLQAGFFSASVLLNAGAWINTETGFVGKSELITPFASIEIGREDPIEDPTVDPTSRIATFRNAGIILGDVRLGNDIRVRDFEDLFDPVEGTRNDVSFDDALYTINLSGRLDDEGNETPLTGVVGGDLLALGRITTDRIAHDGLVGGKFVVDQLVAESARDALVEFENTGKILSGLTLGRISVSHVDLNNQGIIAGTSGTNFSGIFPEIPGALDTGTFPNISSFFGNQFGDESDRAASVTIHGNAIITNGSATADGSLHSAYIGAAELSEEQREAIGFDTIVPFSDREFVAGQDRINEAPTSTSGHGIYIAGRLVGDSVNYGTIEASEEDTRDDGDAIYLLGGGGPSMEEAVTFTNYGLIKSEHQNGFNSVATSNSDEPGFTHFVNFGTVESGFEFLSRTTSTAILNAVSLQNDGTIRGRNGWVYRGDFVTTPSQNSDLIDVNDTAIDLLGFATTFRNSGTIQSQGTGIFLEAGVIQTDPDATIPNGIYNSGMIHTLSDSVHSDGTNPLYLVNEVDATIQSDFATAVLADGTVPDGSAGTVHNFGDIIGDFGVNYQGTPGDVINETGARILAGQNGFGSSIYIFTEDVNAPDAIVLNRGGAPVAPENLNGEITTTAFYEGDAAIVFEGNSGTIINEAGAKIQALSPPEDDGFFLENGDGAAGVYISGTIVNFNPREDLISEVSIDNAGIIVSTFGRGVDFDTRSSVRGFENSGRITAGANGVEIQELNGTTLYNRAGGIIETTSVDDGWAAIAVLSGIGKIVNEASAFLRADFGRFSESAIFSNSFTELEIENAGTISGVFTLLTFGYTALSNAGDVLATQVEFGDAINLFMGGVIDNQRNGQIIATRDALYIEDSQGAGVVTQIFNRAGALIQGDSDNNDTGFAILSVNNDGGGMEEGIEQVFNSGVIAGGIFLGAGNDIYAHIDSGSVDSLVDGGADADILRFEALTVDQTISAEFSNFETFEKTGLRATVLLTEIEAERGSIQQGTVELGRLASTTEAGVSGRLRLLDSGAALSMGDGSDVTRTMLVVNGPGSAVSADAIIGDVGQQTIVNNEAEISADINLGAGDDRVINRFGTYSGAIALGAGNDTLEVFLRADGTQNGAITGGADGEEGTDAVIYSIASGSRRLATLPTVGPALTSFEGIGKGGAGELIFDFTPDDAPEVLRVLDGRLVLAQDFSVIQSPSGSVSETGTALLSEAEEGDTSTELANEAELNLAGRLSMENNTQFTNRPGAQVTAVGGIVGDDGEQTVLNEDGATVFGPVSLGGGNDRVVNRFGVYQDQIDLGAGDDILEVFLDGITGEIGGTLEGTPDGGEGVDTIVYSLESGTFTLSESPELSPESGLVNFEGIGKGGAGNLIFGFDEDILAGTASISGPAELNVGIVLSESIADGRLTLIEESEPTEFQTRLIVRERFTSEGGVQMQGDTALEFFDQTDLGSGLFGDEGNQTIFVANSASLTGTLDVGLGTDELMIDRSSGAVFEVTEGKFNGFERVDLNAGDDSTGTFEISGADTFGADNGALSNVVLNRGTLSGTGEILGNVTIGGMGDEAVLAAGTSPGTLLVAGDLTLTADSQAIFELFGSARLSVADPLDPQNDLIIVGGDLTLDGGLAIVEDADGVDWANGNFYTLFQYGGSLDGPGFQSDNLSSLPGGAPGWSVDTTTIPGEVIIIYFGAAAPPTIYWDGGDGAVMANNAIDGGAGIWDGDNTNWTTEPGDFNNIWSPGLGIFRTVGGSVEINGVQAFQELRFEVGGYVLEDQVGGDGGLRMLGGGSTIDVVAGASVTVDVPVSDPIAGLGLFTKSGAGRLVLSEVNTHSGGTAIVGGTLALANASALGTSTLGMADGTTLEAAIDGLSLTNTVTNAGAGASLGTIDTADNTLTLTGALQGDDDDRFAKVGAGVLVVAGSFTTGGFDVDAGGLVVSGTGALSADLTMAAQTDLNLEASALFTVSSGIFGDNESQTIENQGILQVGGPDILLEGGSDQVALISGSLSGDAGAATRIDFGSDDDSLTIGREANFVGIALGGLGFDELGIDRSLGVALEVVAEDFIGFEQIDLNVSADATGTFEISGADVFGADSGELSSVTLNRGTLTGAGRIAGGLSILGGAVISPGVGTGTLAVAGDYDQSGTYRLDYRVPADSTNFVTTPDGTQALVGLNTVFGLGGAPLAGSTTDQDADLLVAGGSATLIAGAEVILSAQSPIGAFTDAIQLPGNTANEIRYLVLRAEGGGSGAATFSGIALGDIGLEYQNDLGAVVADPIAGSWTNAILVVSGAGILLPDRPPAAGSASAIYEYMSLRPESVNGGCLPEKVLLFGKDDFSDGSCIWMEAGASVGSADLDPVLSEDLSEWQIDVGGEMQFGSETEMSQTRVGVFVGYRETDINYSSGPVAKIETNRIGVYADLRRGRTDLRFGMIWADHDVDTTRAAVSDGQDILGSFAVQTLSFNAELTQWSYIDPCWDLGWLAGLSHTSGERDAYAERGSSLEAFQYAASASDALWATLGVKARYRSHGPSGLRKPNGARVSTDVNLFAGLDALVAGDPAFGATGSYLGNISQITTGTGSSRWEETALRLEGNLAMKLTKTTTFSAALGGRFTDALQDYRGSLQLSMEW